MELPFASERYASCVSFVEGARYGYHFGVSVGATRANPEIEKEQLMRHLQSAGYCLPQNVTNLQILKMVIAWLDDHPQALIRPAGYLVAPALNNTFPCPSD